MPRMAQNAAMSFPDHVIGTESPYPTVHSVTCAQREYNYDAHIVTIITVLWSHFNTRPYILILLVARSIVTIRPIVYTGWGID